ncbi:MAG: ferrous iron transport protein B, partial [bacterium]|nr:ferrous iron transport protein B [bacterium]
TIVDLPGIYSLYAVSEDEKVAAQYACSDEPDIIVNIVDAVNLERNLYLTMALMEMGKPMVMVLSMMDIVTRQGSSIDIATLSKRLGIPVVSADVSKREHRKALEAAILEAVTNKQQPISIPYPETLSQAITKAAVAGEPAYTAIQRLEGILPGAENLIQDIEADHGLTPDVLIADARYTKIATLTQGIITRGAKANAESVADKIVLNRWLGIPIFLSIMYLLFWVTQVVGGCFIDFFDILGDAIFVTGVGNILTLCGAPEWMHTFLATGLGGGIQTVMTFIPPVFFIFMGLAILEDSGYMARAAYVVDRFMRFLGLPGSAFVPMLVGFGCTVPAIMATRTLSNRRDRLLTIFMAPFMSCGARLPVYALFGAAFFGIASGGMVFAIYMSGILLAVFTGLLLKHTLFIGEPAPFVLELPLYHFPRPITVLKRAWNRLSVFIFRAGKVMALMVLVLAVANVITVPNVFEEKDQTPAIVTDATTNDTDEGKISIIEFAGRTMAPIFKPMGVENDNWQGSVALIVGLFAKEQVVSSLNTLYGTEATDEDETESTEELTWGSAGITFKDGISEAFATIPDAFSGLLGGFFDAFGLAVFQTEYQNMIELAEAEQYETLIANLDLEGKTLAADEAARAFTAAHLTAEKTPSETNDLALEDATATFEATAAALDEATAIAEAAVTAKLIPERKGELIATLTQLHENTLAADGAEAEHSLLEKLREKFGDGEEGRHRAYAYLLFILLYVPCLAAMATVVREIGWGYANILFGYLTLLGWCVATLYFQLTVGHQALWIIIPLVLLALTAGFFYLLGKKHKVKLVV